MRDRDLDPDETCPRCGVTVRTQRYGGSCRSCYDDARADERFDRERDRDPDYDRDPDRW